MTSALQTTQLYQVFIKATPQAIWDAITDPAWNSRYGYGGDGTFDLTPGGAYRCIANAEMQAAGMPEVVVTGEVIEADPPYKLVQTWDAGWNADPATTLTYEIAESAPGVCQAHGHPRRVRRAGDRGDGGGCDRWCRRRLGDGPQRPEDAPGDRIRSLRTARRLAARRLAGWSCAGWSCAGWSCVGSPCACSPRLRPRGRGSRVSAHRRGAACRQLLARARRVPAHRPGAACRRRLAARGSRVPAHRPRCGLVLAARAGSPCAGPPPGCGLPPAARGPG